VGTTITSPHIIFGPVYILHCAYDISEHGSGSGHAAGVGHGGGVVKKSSWHPHFLHVFIVDIFYSIMDKLLI